MRLNNYIKNSDYTGEKQLQDIYRVSISIPAKTTVGGNIYTKKVSIPSGNWIYSPLIHFVCKSKNVDITTSDLSFFSYSDIDHWYLVDSTWTASSNFSIQATINFHSSSEVGLYVSARNYTSMPDSTLSLEIRLSEPPF